MPATSNAAPAAIRVITSLRLGDRVVSRCGDGLLTAEYALFDPSETVLRATDPVTVREAGYMTTAREALERLATAGVTPEFAADAAGVLAPGVAASFARGPSARSLAVRLGAQELFDGAIYSAVGKKYEGAWLDLRALSTALTMPSAPVILQALHLAATLAEVAPSTPLLLSTASVTRDRPPGERTHFRVILNATRGLLRALQHLAPSPRPIDMDAASDRRLREVLLARVRERLLPDSGSRLRDQLTSLEEVLEGEATPSSPLADPELRAIERQLANGSAQGIVERLEQIERERGPSAGTRYLRARTALLQGKEPPRSIAQTLSQLADEETGFHEAVLVAARAWLAAGEDAHARYFARKLAEDAHAGDGERLGALEILESTTSTNRSNVPPAMNPNGSPRSGPSPIPRAGLARVPRFPSLGDVPLPDGVPAFPTLPPPRWSSPPPRTSVAVGPGSIVRRDRVRYDPELVESLALPFGSSESLLAANETPTNALLARIAMTRLARDLAREYRLMYQKSLRCDVLAVDAMQQHLARRFTGAPIAEPSVAWELRRHGALLSEILARALGSDWIDVAPSEPGYWAMLIPPSTRSWPIGRVYRFVAQGHRERDLVSYYLDLEARARGAQE